MLPYSTIAIANSVAMAKNAGATIVIPSDVAIFRRASGTGMAMANNVAIAERLDGATTASVVP